MKAILSLGRTNPKSLGVVNKIEPAWDEFVPDNFIQRSEDGFGGLLKIAKNREFQAVAFDSLQLLRAVDALDVSLKLNSLDSRPIGIIDPN